MNFPYLYSNPTGGTEPITFPITEIFREFPGRQGVQSENGTEIGLINLDRPYTLPIWSTVATGQWELTPYVITYAAQKPPERPVPPIDAITPEPSLTAFLVFACFVGVMLKRLRVR